MKRKSLLSGVLAAVMLMSMVPAYAETPETAETNEPVTQETAAPTESPEETLPVETAPAGTEAPEETEPVPTESPEEPRETLPVEEQTVVKYWSNTESVFAGEHIAYMSGYGSGYFKPNTSLTWGQVCVMLCRLMEDRSIGEQEYTLTHVQADRWYTESMQVLASRGLLTKDPDPNAVICRADFVELLCSCAGVDPEGKTCSFPDVPEDSEWYAAVSAAVDAGWIMGYTDGTFGPEDSLTRAQAVVIINRMLNRSVDPDLKGDHSACHEYRDVSEGSWYYGAVMEATTVHTAVYDEAGQEQWASYTPVYTVSFSVKGTVVETEYISEGDNPWMPSGISGVTHWMSGTNAKVAQPASDPVTGNVTYTAWYAPALNTTHDQYVEGTGNGKFSPNSAMTRAQAASMLYRLLKDQTMGAYGSSFTDVKSGSWYYQAVTVLASKGILTSGGAFRPNEVMTRSEFAEMLTRLIPYTDRGTSLTDVTKDDPNYAAITTAVNAGWINGFENGTFGGSSSLTRAQAVVIFNRVLGRTGDPKTEAQMDSRYTFTDVPSTFWAYQAIMEAATTHTWTANGSSESWSTYTHTYTASVNWESSDSVVAAASITNSVTSTYSGNYTHSYNWDYSNAAAEAYVNSKGYSSSTSYLLWVSRQNQKVYCFLGSKGNWKLYKTMICGTGKASTPTPTGVTYVTYRQQAWYYTSDIVYKPVRFYPGTGYAFHSRLHNYGSGYYDSRIGFPVSAGCVRMLDNDITFIYNYVPNNTTVVIY